MADPSHVLGAFGDFASGDRFTTVHQAMQHHPTPASLPSQYVLLSTSPAVMAPAAAQTQRAPVAHPTWPSTGMEASRQPASPTPCSRSGSGFTTSLYVKGLPPEADELFLFHVFAPHGALHSCKVKCDPSTGRCSGVAFVNYMDLGSAMRAIAALDGALLTSGGTMHVTLQAPRAQRAATAAKYRTDAQPAASMDGMLLAPQCLPATQICPAWPTAPPPAPALAWHGGYALAPPAPIPGHLLAPHQNLALHSTW